MKKYLLIIGLVFAAIFQLVKLNEVFQLYFFAMVLLLTGVPHGSLDYFVEEQTLKRSHQKISLSSFLFTYLLNMASYAIVWVFFPTFALVLFIGLTAFHFGEIDWPVRNNTKLDSALYTIYGFQIIIFIITSHIKESAPILEMATRHRISSGSWLLWGNVAFKYCSIFLACSLILLATFQKRIGWNSKILFQFASQTIVLVSVIYLLPLYLSFGFYFGFWHSVLSFNLIRRQMNLAHSLQGWLQLIKKAIPFTLVAWIGLAAMISLSITTNTQLMVLTNLFIGIAVLTLPHLQVFTKIKLR